ncbi:hypothetical protein [Faecalibaculum rodentium]|uniref:hypothetical protein n=1 Tax=Faecalibaculum rodentium TaxID=1702221 RepID=UPI0023EF8E1E|nr:hypothetical protein [Faecalibaculum rodentium]
MTLNYQTVLVLILQCAVQGWFLSGYFGAGRRGFLVYSGFFLFILYPLDIQIPFDWVIFKNLLNFVLLFLFFMAMKRTLTVRKLVLAVVLYWLPLPLSEIPVHFLNLAFDLYPLFKPEAASVFAPQATMTFFMQLLATLILAVFYGCILKKTRAASLNQTIRLYLTSLLASLAALAFLCLCFVYPEGEASNFLQYPLAVAMLASFNVWFVISMRRYVKEQTAIQAD